MAFAQRGGAGGKSLCSPWMEAVDSVLQCGRSGRGSWNRTGEAGGRGCENGPDVGNGKPVFLCGFSAGGHVAASLGVLWNEPEIFSKDQAESIRPDGLILGYPVISAGEWAHRGSFEMLAGDDLEKQQFFSLENHVDQEIPPVFLWHTAEDPTVPVENSPVFCKTAVKI